MNVVFIVFNRPELSRRVFAEISKARPQRLFLVADGPRPGKPDDVRKVEEVREIVSHIDWPCEVLRDYSNVNLGCRRRVTSGLDWVFSKVDDAIILEDDCLPHQDFFRFCSEMLEMHHNDQRVGHICGTNFDPAHSSPVYSYGFSIYASIWGWATWRRCWVEHDSEMGLWRDLKAARRHYDMFFTKQEAEYFGRLWDDLSEGRLNAWGARWLFTRLVNGTLSVRPCVNLVSNIGFGEDADATHTTSEHRVGNWPVAAMSFPLRHPVAMVVDRQSDERHACLFFRNANPVWVGVKQTVLNRYWYGKWLRKTPFVGRLWCAIRGQSTERCTSDANRTE